MFWTNHMLTNLVATNFYEIRPSSTNFSLPDSHPDFSPNAAPITFGFFRGNSSSIGSGGGLNTGGVDNWTMVVHPAPYLFISLEAPGIKLEWDSETNRLYQVQYKPDLSTAAWANLGVSVAGSGTNCVLHDANEESQRFYRLVCLQ